MVNQVRYGLERAPQQHRYVAVLQLVVVGGVGESLPSVVTGALAPKSNADNPAVTPRT